ncbi:hypothetical protein [Pseudomonas jilinensis]|uniref:hypothetical protein n=1 Tax=Pseudomonas jilinensis TaxID=2078689 RepID=UPI0010341A5E|nr:hypothetical protein [Pseudomonas jilinensis]
MKIYRSGSTADHGETHVELSSPIFSWNKSESCLVVKKPGVKDFTGKSRHNYKVLIDINDLNKIMSLLAETALESPGPMEKYLEPSLKSILQLKAVVSGVKT